VPLTPTPDPIRPARLFAGWLDADPDWERLAPATARGVCFRVRPRGWDAADGRLDALNERLLLAVSATGEVCLSRAVRRGRSALRLAIGPGRTGERHVRRAWEILRGEALRLGAGPVVMA